MSTVVKHTRDHRGMVTSRCPKCNVQFVYWDADDLDADGNLLCDCDEGSAPICPGCNQEIVVTDGLSECGGEGEGICCVMCDEDEPCDFHPSGHTTEAVAEAQAAHAAARHIWEAAS